MKIGIMTYWWSNDNYGQLLQCYALQKYLRDAGHDAYLIRYNMSNDYTPEPILKRILKIFDPIKLEGYLSHIKRLINARLMCKENEKRMFDEFRSEYLIQSDKIYFYYDELKKEPPEADAYIVGSDQVWNLNSYKSQKKLIGAYYLDFGNSSTKRISYAVSFGREKIDDDVIKIITPLLQKFNYVSVREKTGLDICKQCGINNTEWVPDPTMLLDADVYRMLYKKDHFRKPEKRYCLLYLLGNTCNFSVQILYDWAKNQGFDVVYVSASAQIDKFEKKYATIPEWIYLVEHAEYVITNSYHCCVFSLIFGKKFGVIPLSKDYVDANTRLDSMFDLFKIEKRYICDSVFSVLDNEIDWQLVYEIFHNLRKNCKLLDILNKKELADKSSVL